MLGLGLKADGAAGTVHQHNLAAGFVEYRKYVALGLGQLDVGAVAALETGLAHFHLLAFKCGGYTAYEHHRVIAFGGFHYVGFCGGVLVEQVEHHHGHVGALLIVYLELVALAGFYMQGLIGKLHTVAAFPNVYQGVAVHNQAGAVVKRHANLQVFTAAGSKSAFIAGTEVLQVHTGGENGVAAVAQTDGLADVALGCRTARKVFIIIIGGFHAGMAFVADLAETALLHLIAGQTATAVVVHIAGYVADAFQNGGGGGGVAVVVGPLHHRVVGVGAHHKYLLAAFAEGKEVAAVLKEGHRLAGHVKGQLLVLRTQ